MADNNGSTKPADIPPGYYFGPRFTPDGKQIAYHTDDGKEAIVWVNALDAGGSVRRLTSSGRNLWPVWTRDGQRLDGNAEPKALIQTPRFAVHSSLSPDGRWITYSSGSQSGQVNIFVQALPATGKQYQVSRNGGSNPLWSPDGSRLYFMTTESRGQRHGGSVELGAPPNSDSLNPGLAPAMDVLLNVVTHTVDISPDGEQFIGMTNAAEVESQRQVLQRIMWSSIGSRI